MAAGYSVAQVVGLLWPAVVLRRRLHGFDTLRVVRTHVGLGIVSAAAGGASWLFARWVAHTWGAGPSASLVALAGGVLLFVALTGPVGYPLSKRLRSSAHPVPAAGPTPDAPSGRHRRA
jgi:hypothetical protein